MIQNISIWLLTIILFPCLVFGEVYVIKKGDNIWKISKKYSISVDEIKKMNGLKNNKLQVGMKIQIPSENNKKPKTKNQDKNSKYHTVKRGETLYRIAKKYNISVDEIKKMNGLKNNEISIGQQLIVKTSVESKENISIRQDEKVPIISTAKANVDIENKEEEIEKIKASEDLANMSLAERLLLFAKKMLHLPYKFGGNNFNGLDCSFFVKKVYSMIGFDLPRTAREQFTLGIPVDKDELKPGDLIFFKTYAKFPSHVGIYLGDSLFIHASTRSKKVTIDSIETPYYLKRFIGAKRILENEGDKLKKVIGEINNPEN